MSAVTVGQPVLLARGFRFEAEKSVSGRAWWITVCLMMVAQPLLSYVSGLQLAQTGVDATPESDPWLYGPLPPVDHLGFDVITMGQLMVVVLAVVLGAVDYVNGEFRTSLLAVNSRPRLVLAKLLSFTVLGTVLIAVSSWLTLVVMHVALGDQGLDPVTLSPLAWSLFLRSTVATAGLGLIAYCLALVLRSRVLALVIMVPQIVGPGTLLAMFWAPAAYLPGLIAARLFTAPMDASDVSLGAAAIALLAWVVVAVVITWIVVSRRDAGAR